ncbi:MAG: HD domain-containing protein [Bacillota bacterium]
MKKIYLSDLNEGQQVYNIFQVKKKELVPFKEKQGKFLSLVLGDRSGEMDAKVWERAEDLAQGFVLHDFIVVKGVVTKYNQKLQITIENLKKIVVKDKDLFHFLPVSPRDGDEMWAELGNVINIITNKHLKALVNQVFSDLDLADKFRRAPAAKSHHQAYLGGLLEHTLNVALVAKKIGENYAETDLDLLLTGALFHDIGKVAEFSYDKVIDYNDAGRLLGHIVMGASLIDQKIAAIDQFPEILRVKVLHMIVSHHGKYEWQSPKRPKFLEAAILHQADLLDAEVDKFVKVKTEETEELWPYVRNLDRYVFKG